MGTILNRQAQPIQDIVKKENPNLEEFIFNLNSYTKILSKSSNLKQKAESLIDLIIKNPEQVLSSDDPFIKQIFSKKSTENLNFFKHIHTMIPNVVTSKIFSIMQKYQNARIEYISRIVCPSGAGAKFSILFYSFLAIYNPDVQFIFIKDFEAIRTKIGLKNLICDTNWRYSSIFKAAFENEEITYNQLKDALDQTLKKIRRQNIPIIICIAFNSKYSEPKNLISIPLYEVLKTCARQLIFVNGGESSSEDCILEYVEDGPSKSDVVLFLKKHIAISSDSEINKVPINKIMHETAGFPRYLLRLHHGKCDWNKFKERLEGSVKIALTQFLKAENLDSENFAIKVLEKLPVRIPLSDIIINYFKVEPVGGKKLLTPRFGSVIVALQKIVKEHSETFWFSIDDYRKNPCFLGYVSESKVFDCLLKSEKSFKFLELKNVESTSNIQYQKRKLKEMLTPDEFEFNQQFERINQKKLILSKSKALSVSNQSVQTRNIEK